MADDRAEVYAALTFDVEEKRTDSKEPALEDEGSNLLFVAGQEDLKDLSVADELYEIPADKGRVILYSPLSKACLLINRPAVDLINSVRDKRAIELDKRTIAFLNYLILYGIVGLRDAEAEKVAEAAGKGEGKVRDELIYAPTGVSICPTTDCNLRCIYCYASGGERVKYMDFDLARHAIDFVVDNAVKRKAKKTNILFHGGGEPMMAFDLIKRSVDHMRMRAKERGLECSFSIGTNLFYGEERLNYLIENFSGATVSLDGTKDIHDFQRPAADGSSSFDKITDNLKVLDEKGLSYGLRTTVTKRNINRLNEIVEFFVTNFKARSYSFEPLVLAHRAVDTRLEGVEYPEFMEAFLKAREVAKRHGRDLSTTCIDLSKMDSKFCGAMGEGFWVTPDGLVTTCAEVLDLADPLARYFIIGRFDRDRDDFVFDYEKIKILKKRTINEIAACKACFARYHCSGSCPVKLMRQGAEYMQTAGSPGSHCEPVKRVIAKKLLEMLTKEESKITEDDYIKLGEPEKLSEADFRSEKPPIS